MRACGMLGLGCTWTAPDRFIFRCARLAPRRFESVSGEDCFALRSSEVAFFFRSSLASARASSFVTRKWTRVTIINLYQCPTKTWVTSPVVVLQLGTTPFAARYCIHYTLLIQRYHLISAKQYCTARRELLPSFSTCSNAKSSSHSERAKIPIIIDVTTSMSSGLQSALFARYRHY